jgi:Ca2+:H+ antiporter
MNKQENDLIVSHNAASSMNSSINSITQHNENQTSQYISSSPAAVQPHKLVEPTVQHGLLSIVKSSWLNFLLVFIPFGWASHFVWPPTITFILNFIAIVPLAKLLGFATEDIALRTGEVIGALLNATFGNAVEFIISVISLTQNLVIVVQASMLGSILSNLLLVLGMSFFVGGCKYKEQKFNMTAAQTSASLLFISVVSLLLPAAFYGSTANVESAINEKTDILNISRATSIILLIIYLAFMFFQVTIMHEKTNLSIISFLFTISLYMNNLSIYVIVKDAQDTGKWR